MRNLCPISLCNVLYKIISKIITKRLQPIMDFIIGLEQNAFTKGGLIFDNILIFHEVMHSLKNRSRGRNCGMAVKLDINKAYECIEWAYLNHILQFFGFHHRWIDWIMACILTVSYSLQVNSHKVGFITHPEALVRVILYHLYLFLLCMEGLSHKIKSLSLRGINIFKHGPTLTHLLFADNSIILFKATRAEAYCINQIMNSFSQVSR